MNTSHPRLAVRTKIWIEDEKGGMVFGAGRMQILSAVEECGSILSAAKVLGMSYRAVWGKIKATEQRLGQPVLEKQAGGVNGGGSSLTPLGRSLVERFRQLEELSKTSTDAFFHGVFNAAI